MGNLKTFKVHMGPANCALDIGDGSERGEYVNQDYILQTLGRPHRAVSLMYCYYPNDEGWPGRASVVHASDDVKFQWDYPYDDYYTYKGGLNGNLEDEPFNYMRDVRRHGQDVLLTLTIDPKLTDDHIEAIAKDLSTFGRVMLRINHEATGDWFSFNKRADYPEVAAFFKHCCEIIHKTAPNVKVIICLDGCSELGEEKMAMEDVFAEASKAADIVSVDRYLTLHWGWPYDVCNDVNEAYASEEKYFNTETYFSKEVKEVYELCKRSYERYTLINGGVERPMVLSEMNADGDVTGAYKQADMVKEFCNMLKADKQRWLSGFTMYQFRDRGRLGLEIEDPNNKDVGIRQPVFDTYKDIMHDEFFEPKMTIGDKTELPATLRWGGSEDADGLAISLHFEKSPVFCEAYFEDENLINENLMLEINDYWFYKAPGVKCIDLMSAFFQNPLHGEEDLTLKVFAPPASGENDPSQGEDWQENYYREIKALPVIRTKYAPVG
ncbi:MAG: hypothetical protein K6F77_01360 [Lachnospiraceae bacterium]|nr:hypothetical protein [Lachnospiraceae bacterium]